MNFQHQKHKIQGFTFTLILLVFNTKNVHTIAFYLDSAYTGVCI